MREEYDIQNFEPKKKPLCRKTKGRSANDWPLPLSYLRLQFS